MLVNAAQFPDPALFQGVALILLAIWAVWLYRDKDSEIIKCDAEQLAKEYEEVNRHLDMAKERAKRESQDFAQLQAMSAADKLSYFQVLEWKRFYVSQLIAFRRKARKDAGEPYEVSFEEVDAELKKIDESDLFPGLKGKELVDAWTSNGRLAWHSATNYTGDWFAMGPKP